ncbi:unnamed protein product [Closterium sp. NIES-64]|nr:unnamed protein product [Closterium sp. NIES-64]
MPPIPVIHTLPPLRYLLSRAAHISSRAHPLPVTPVAFPIPVTSSPSTSILVASPPSHIPSPSHRLPFCRLLPSFPAPPFLPCSLHPVVPYYLPRSLQLHQRTLLDVPCAYPSLAPSSPHPHPTLTPPSPHPHPTLAPPPPHPHPTLASSFHSLSLPFFLLDPFTSPSLLSSLLFVPLTGGHPRLSQPATRSAFPLCTPHPHSGTLVYPSLWACTSFSVSSDNCLPLSPLPFTLSASPLPFPLSASPSPLPPLRFPLSPSPSPLPPLPFPLSASPSPLPPLPHQYDSPLCLNLSGLLLFFLLLRGAHVSVAVLCRLAAILPRPEGLPPAAVRLCLNPHPTVLHGPGPLFENSKKPATRLPLLPYPEGPPLLPYPEGHPRAPTSLPVSNTRCLPSLQPPPPQYYTLLCLNLPVQCRTMCRCGLNLSGLVLFFLTLRGVHVSVAVPVSNGATFGFNAAAGYAFGEKIQPYYVPLCLNLSGSVLFFLTLRGVHVSVAVPVSNGATFAFNAAAGCAFGEKIQPALALGGVSLAVLGIALCV